MLRLVNTMLFVACVKASEQNANWVVPNPPPTGLSPDLQSMEQIRRIMRPTDVPDQGLLCDLLWSDPDKDVLGWGENDRGVSFTFGAEVVAKFLHKHDLDLICRAHQVGCLWGGLALRKVPPKALGPSGILLVYSIGNRSVSCGLLGLALVTLAHVYLWP